MTRTEATEKFLAEATSHIYDPRTGKGLRERNGSNRDPWIDAANDLCNVEYGSAWCASFLARCGFLTLGKAYPVPLTASCDILLNFGRTRGILYTTAKRGDIMLLLNPSNRNDATHTGAVLTAGAKGVGTVEGNTNNDGGREGWGCLQHSRNYGPRLIFVRWANLLDDLPAVPNADKPGTWSVLFGPDGKPTDRLPAIIQNEAAYVDYSEYAAAIFGVKGAEYIGWEPNGNTLLWQGKPLPQSVPRFIRGGDSWVGVRAMSEFINLAVAPNPEKKSIQVYRPAAVSK